MECIAYQDSILPLEEQCSYGLSQNIQINSCSDIVMLYADGARWLSVAEPLDLDRADHFAFLVSATYEGFGIDYSTHTGDHNEWGWPHLYPPRELASELACISPSHNSSAEVPVRLKYHPAYRLICYYLPHLFDIRDFRGPTLRRFLVDDEPCISILSESLFSLEQYSFQSASVPSRSEAGILMQLGLLQCFRDGTMLPTFRRLQRQSIPSTFALGVER